MKTKIPDGFYQLRPDESIREGDAILIDDKWVYCHEIGLYPRKAIVIRNPDIAFQQIFRPICSAL